MTVFDASVFIDALVSTGPTGRAARAWLRETEVLEVPAIFSAEVTSGLSALVRRGGLSPRRASAALEQMKAARTTQFQFDPFVDRAWELRRNLTIYDGWYVALAESLETDLVTSDKRLASAPGPRCAVRYVTEAPPA